MTEPRGSCWSERSDAMVRAAAQEVRMGELRDGIRIEEEAPAPTVLPGEAWRVAVEALHLIALGPQRVGDLSKPPPALTRKQAMDALDRAVGMAQRAIARIEELTS